MRVVLFAVVAVLVCRSLVCANPPATGQRITNIQEYPGTPARRIVTEIPGTPGVRILTIEEDIPPPAAIEERRIRYVPAQAPAVRYVVLEAARAKPAYVPVYVVPRRRATPVRDFLFGR